MVEGGSLENCCAERYRGFKSYFLRHLILIRTRSAVSRAGSLFLQRFDKTVDFRVSYRPKGLWTALLWLILVHITQRFTYNKNFSAGKINTFLIYDKSRMKIGDSSGENKQYIRK